MVTTPFALFSAYATPYELAHALRIVKPRYIFVQPSLLPTAITAAKEVRLPTENIFTLNGQTRGFTSLQDIVKRVQARGVHPAHVHSATRDALAYLIFSSGTTGLPKGMFALSSWRVDNTCSRIDSCGDITRESLGDVLHRDKAQAN